VELVRLHDQEYLFYRAQPIDVAVIRGTTADERGNVTMEDEPYFGEQLSIAQAAAQPRGDRRLPGRAARRGGDPSRQAGEGARRAGGLPRRRARRVADLRHAVRSGVRGRGPDARRRRSRGCRSTSARSSPGGRRSSCFPGAIVNLGFGVSNGIAPVAAEEGIHRDVTLTVEQGIVGGVPAGGNDAGAGHNYDAMIDQPYQFDFYDGGGLDIAFLSFAEVDADGNVNVSRFGRVVNGPGGFVNISQGARKVVFSGR
jgi:propionate CoA-transferase